jgi:hypothetical protein
MFRAVEHLCTRRCLLVAGSALLDVDENEELEELENGHARIKTRLRLGDDGGKSLTAAGNEYPIGMSDD